MPFHSLLILPRSLLCKLYPALAWSAGSDGYIVNIFVVIIGSAANVNSGLSVTGATCNIPPDHDDGCGSPEPDLSVPHHLPEMDTDIPR